MNNLTSSANQLSRLQVTGATKLYGGTPAIQGVDFTVRAGEVHAIVGENGAGKSTLTKAIAGAVQLTSGEIRLDGEVCRFKSPADALRRGIVMVYQEDSLVPTMTVAQNVHLGREKFLSRLRALNISAQQLLQSMNFNVEPNDVVATLGTAKRQMVEIARAVYYQAQVIIFDEPTASLTPEEMQHLFLLIEDLRRRGLAIVFISHALEEALTLADRITVLRDAKKVITAPASEFDRDKLVHYMVGRQLTSDRHESDTYRKRSPGQPLLRVQNVIAGTMVKNMSFSVFAGEVLGIAGLVGSGRTEVAQVIAGIRKRNFLQGGAIYLDGRPVRYRVPAQAIQDGIAYVTEDRKVAGFFETMNVDENIYLGWLSTPAGRRRLGYSTRHRDEVSAEWVKKTRITAINRHSKVIELSGGNQQKVVVAKSLVQEPRLIILDEPTRGVDVGSIAEIHQLIRGLARDGKAVVVISSYLPEILNISDRILVARGGQIVAEFKPEDATQEKIMYAAVH
ncbi:MAG: sugar ABC transporter ATP-binding protein [Burkholderiaceae bacterium]|jgi:ABC-type sugar transport system ATPase subunit|nr:MAG: sugar ABC transporter ATP-binding protein [Burkholderiaceae bacterium]TBR77365.1 MAG: sugar ABC transporter ATP-binding protein [Burkholderiaceae bacterium]